MKRKSFIGMITILLVFSFIFDSCGKKTVSISAYPQNGSAGDIIIINVTGAKVTKDAEVRFGPDKAPVLESTDSTLTVMVPPQNIQSKVITVNIDKQSSETPFQIDKPSTMRLWFSIKDNAVRFMESQPSNQDFVQDNSYSPNKLMYEITDDKGESIAVGYINDPLRLEVPSVDGKGFSNIELKGETKFDINVPALTNMNSIKFTAINSSTDFKAKSLGEVSLKGYLK
ncbi:MAG: IPT/TIG domain-containing protein [Ignavibacteria bacterium]